MHAHSLAVLALHLWSDTYTVLHTVPGPVTTPHCACHSLGQAVRDIHNRKMMCVSIEVCRWGLCWRTALPKQLVWKLVT